MITVGIPVYNEEKYIEKAILSVLHKADKIIISDNCSNDRTGEICEKFASKYKHIKYIKQPTNIDIMKNWEACLKECNTKYFMFLGGHDLVPENYIDCLVESLEKNSEAVLAYAPVKYITNSESEIIGEYDYFYFEYLKSLDPYIRMYTLMSNLSDCSLLHGVFKTEILKNSFNQTRYYHREISSDMILLCNVIAYGTFYYNNNTSFIRRKVREESLLESTVRYIDYFYEKVDLQTIYSDFNKGLREGQLSAIKNIEEQDVYRKNFWLEKSKKILQYRYSSRIPLEDYINKWEYLNEKNLTIFRGQKQMGKIAIFGTYKIAMLLLNECNKSDINVVTFIDNKNEGHINGVPINNTEWLKINKDKYDSVIITIEGSHDLTLISELRSLLKDKLIISWKNLILYKLLKN